MLAFDSPRTTLAKFLDDARHETSRLAFAGPEARDRSLNSGGNTSERGDA